MSIAQALAALLLLAAPPHADLQKSLQASRSFSAADYFRELSAIEKVGVAAQADLIAFLRVEKNDNALGFACDALAKVGDAAALPVLASRLADASWTVRSSCGSAYGEILSTRARGADLALLRPLIQSDGECPVRVNIATAVGPRDDPSLRALWMSWLRHGSSCDRETALAGLAGATKDRDEAGKAALPFLESEDDSWLVRDHAAIAVGKLSYRPALPVIRQIISQRQEPDGNVRWLCIRALGEMGGPEDLPLLRSAIDADPYRGEGVVATEGREAIAKIQKRK
jgi:HEAT repeat protein